MSKAMAIANAAVPKGAVAIVKCFAGSKGEDGAARPDVKKADPKPGNTTL